jgi:hypothetical protein
MWKAREGWGWPMVGTCALSMRLLIPRGVAVETFVYYAFTCFQGQQHYIVSSLRFVVE